MKGVHPSQRPGTSAFVGREAELELLGSALALAVQGPPGGWPFVCRYHEYLAGEIWVR